MKAKLLFVIFSAMGAAGVIHHQHEMNGTIDPRLGGSTMPPLTSGAVGAASPGPSGAWMWQNRDDYLNKGQYAWGPGSYTPGYSVTLHPESATGGSEARARQGVDDAQKFGHVTNNNQNPLDQGAYNER